MLIWVKTYQNVIFNHVFEILFKIFEKYRFLSKLANISILVRIFEKFQFWWKISKISILIEIFGRSQISSKFSNNLDVGQNGRKYGFWSKLTKMSILVKIEVNFDLNPNFRRMSTLDKTYQFVDLGQNWRKCWFYSNCLKSFWSFSKFPKISILSKLSKNVGLEILILGKIVEKSEIWSKLSKILDFS